MLFTSSWRKIAAVRAISIRKLQKLTLKQYYRAFGSTSGFLAGLSALSPLATALSSGPVISYVFPPLGSTQTLARIATIVMGFSTTYLIFFVQSQASSKNRGRRFVTVFAGAFIFLICYVTLCSGFVRVLDIPSLGTSVAVSVGYERTDFAKSNFGSVNDWQLLRERGTREEDISELWTKKSLLLVRFGLFFSISAVVVFLVAGFSTGVLYQSQLRE
jgi:hypothetical protein